MLVIKYLQEMLQQHFTCIGTCTNMVQQHASLHMHLTLTDHVLQRGAFSSVHESLDSVGCSAAVRPPAANVVAPYDHNTEELIGLDDHHEEMTTTLRYSLHVCLTVVPLSDAILIDQALNRACHVPCLRLVP